MPSTETHFEQNSARFIRGIGPKRFEALNRLGIQTIRDLCYFFPRRYEDRTQFQSVASIKPGGEVTIRCEVLALGVRPLKNLSIFEMMVGDKTGVIPAVWFNQPYLKNQFQMGDQIILSGKADWYQKRVQLNSPEYERVQEEEHDTVHTGRITPIYPLTEGLAERAIRSAMKEVIDHHVPKELREFLPEEIRKKYSLMDLVPAIQNMHFTESFELLEAARKRVIFDEFFIFELILLSKIRAIRAKEKSFAFQRGEKLLSEFSHALPFELTEDQLKTIHEILENVSTEIPMNRLLQGEVGSGKTVVAAFFLFLAAKNGLQSALLVPTEILAEQHYQTLSVLLKSLGVTSALLTGSLEAEERERARRKSDLGLAQVLIGTHALLQEEVRFKNLGLVIIDEQHRFGVRQRAQLVLRSPRPHLLVMTATPIPRTLGLTLYGDLDISTIRHLPKGRKEVKTYWINQKKETEVLEHIREKISESDEQAYILFPIIEESERLDLQAATQEYEHLRKGIFRSLSIGLVHGRLLKPERDEVMKKFHQGKLKVLIATSVIEVGVHNPNVTFMVIENAERFGLSQLHQMRGRIGRGTKEGTCFLFGNPTTEEGKKRLRILTKTQDGFVIAEEDLILRGPGDFFGTKQSGIPFFQVGDLLRDSALLMTARKEAMKVLAQDPELSTSEHHLLAQEIKLRRAHFQSQ